MKLTMKQARVGKNMTQREMAKALEIHEQTYSKYEKDCLDMSVRQAQLFSKITGVEFDDIFFA